MQLRTRIILTLLPVLLPVVGFGLMEYRSQSAQLRAQIEHATDSAAAAARMQINTLMRVKYGEFELLAERLYSCKDERQLSDSPEQLSEVLNHVSGFSALVVSDTDGEVLNTRFAVHRNNHYILPRLIHNASVLSAVERRELLAAFRQWQETQPQKRRHLEALRIQARDRVNRGEQLSHQYRELHREIQMRSRNLELPPVRITLGGSTLVRRMGLPFRGDTYMFSLYMPDCSGLERPQLVTVFMDRSQIEDVLYRVRLDLIKQGYQKVDVAMTDREGKRILSDVHFLDVADWRSTTRPSFYTLEPIVDTRVLTIIARRSVQNEDFWFDNAYEQLIDHHSELGVVVYIADAELSMRLQRVWSSTVIWVSAGVLLLLLLILRIARHIVHPVRELEQHLQGVAKGEKGLQMVRRRRDEFGRLADAFNDMTEKLAHKEQTLVRLATTDPLTGLLNRRAFAERAETLHSNGAEPVVMILDLDHFKAINDSYGHGAGDRVLVGFADILQANVRVGDLAGRFGGEEFMVLLDNMDLSDASIIAERIRSLTELHPFEDDRGGVFNVTVSIGLARWSADTPLSQVSTCADSALYRAKSGGRNQVQLAGN